MRLIDADAFYEKFRAGGELYSELLESEDMREILKDEDITPTVDIKPTVHAHWVTGYFHDRVCSRCTHPSNGLSELSFNYCPHCGAKMDEEE